MNCAGKNKVVDVLSREAGRMSDAIDMMEAGNMGTRAAREGQMVDTTAETIAVYKVLVAEFNALIGTLTAKR